MRSLDQPALAPAEMGLDDAEVRRRRQEGLSNDLPDHTSRTLAEILRANLFTRFNAILGTLLLVVLTVGPIQDALFGIVLVTNVIIGVIQELRAKIVLDRLALLNAPRARVVRAGQVKEVAVSDVVLGDVLELGTGDQVVVDGTMLTGQGLEVDESLLTGEAEPVLKAPGDELLSGGFVTAGNARYRATRVGAHAYARQLADDARQFSLVRSELRAGIDRILRMVTWAIIPAGILLVGSQVVARQGLADAVRGSVAGVGAMIPEGLVLLTSVAFAAGVIRLGRRKVLVQELAAVEGLARVDVVCLDKTGTLTEPSLVLSGVTPLGAGVPPEEVLGALAATDPSPNASLAAVAEACPPPGWQAEQVVPFSSARKWSAACFAGHGTWVLGAPEILADGLADPASARAAVDAQIATGRRVMLLARAPGGLDTEGLPAGMEPAAVVALEERLRPDAAETLSYFRAQGVTVKVVSGDHPRTVAAVAERVGLVLDGPPVDARDLPEDPARLAEVVSTHTVFGRVTPHQKRAMVKALQSRGHVVAMTGDGVNDALALKAADIGVAMGSGSEASRAVARLVLLEDSYSSLPAVLAEGRRVIANVERVANLFLTKSVYALVLALAVGVARLPFPFYPRHLTIISSLTIGIPAFFLALAPGAPLARRGFVGRVLRFAVPAGLAAAAATFAGYALARTQPGVTLAEARTTATLVLFLVALWVLAMLARPWTGPRRVLVGLMPVLFIALLAHPGSREFFALDLPPAVVLLAGVGIAAIANTVLEGGWQVAGWFRKRDEAEATPGPPAELPADHPP